MNNISKLDLLEKKQIERVSLCANKLRNKIYKYFRITEFVVSNSKQIRFVVPGCSTFLTASDLYENIMTMDAKNSLS